MCCDEGEREIMSARKWLGNDFFPRGRGSNVGYSVEQLAESEREPASNGRKHAVTFEQSAESML